MNNKRLVVKSNKLIEARYKLTANEQKVICKLISQINQNDEDFKKYTFKVRELADMMDIKRHDFYDEVKKITKGLMQKVFTIKEGKTEIQLSWFSSAKYTNGIVDLEFSPELKPLLLKLKNEFTQYRIGNVMSLKSGYSHRIYELLKQYETIKERTFRIEELKNKLGICENEYSLYTNFKEKVILKSQKELNKKTDLRFTFIENKIGKKVDSITFKIKNTQKYGQNTQNYGQKTYKNFKEREYSDADLENFFNNV